MNSVQTILLDDVRAALIDTILSKNLDELERACAAWLIPGQIDELDIDSIISASLSGDRTPRNCAALGVAAQVIRLDNDIRHALDSAVRQLLGREPIVAGTPMPFCMDGLALGGVLLGVDSIEDDGLKRDARRWLDSCRRVTAEGKGLDAWQEAFLAGIGQHIGIRWESRDDESSTTAVVRVALRSKGIGSKLDIEQEEQDELSALDALRSLKPREIGAANAILHLAALAWIRRSFPIVDFRRRSVRDLCALLNNFAHGLKRWTWEDHPKTKNSNARKWHVDHEYHVQNLLWFLLGPIFPDLDDENYTKKVGPKQPRADIVIPSLRVIVEAKFWRSSDSSKKIIKEIAEDASLYLVEGCPFDGIIPFVWDDSARTEQHVELVRGLKQIDGVLDAIVVARPGSMTPDGVTAVPAK